MKNIFLLLTTAIAFSQAPTISEKALKLHRDAFVFDAHVHVVNRQFHHGGDMGERVTTGHFDLSRAKEGGLKAMFFCLVS